MTWRLTVVDRDGTHAADLDMLDGGTLTFGAGGMRLTVDIGSRNIDTLGGRLVSLTYGATRELLVPIDPLNRSLTGTADTYSLTALGVTRYVDRVKLRRGVTVPRGAFVREAVTDLLYDHLPWLPVTIGDNDGSLREPLAWPPGTPLATPVAALLEAGGMDPLSGAPGEVRLLSDPWVDPAERAAVATFGPATTPENSPFLPSGKLGLTVEPAVNEVLVVTRGTPPITGRWADEAAIVRDGLVSHTLPGSHEATDQAAADAIAARGRGTLRHRRPLSLDARYEPRARYATVVGVDWPRWGVSGRWEVVSGRVSLNPSADANYELLEV